jgi:hypothetical protein
LAGPIELHKPLELINLEVLDILRVHHIGYAEAVALHDVRWCLDGDAYLRPCGQEKEKE